MEVATRNVIFPGSVGLAQAHPLTKPLAMGDSLPPDLVQLRSTQPIRALVLGYLEFFWGGATAPFLKLLGGETESPVGLAYCTDPR